ncbi:hypothetical protein JW711_05605 [Candidatus Woesearchaeota archaeon]|nr:hypothetical protein [Candidatus Woesearchaeota archaeon]
MIKKDGAWIWSINPENRQLIVGKLIYEAPASKLDEVFPKIDELVNQGKIIRAKYNPKRNLEIDHLPFNKPCLIIYSEEKGSPQIRDELVSIGLDYTPTWKYEWQTRIDWGEKGMLRKESQRQRNLWEIMKKTE